MSWLPISLSGVKPAPKTFTELLITMQEWARENVSTPGMLWYFDADRLHFFFRNEEDLVAFKLKFGL